MSKDAIGIRAALSDSSFNRFYFYYLDIRV